MPTYHIIYIIHITNHHHAQGIQVGVLAKIPKLSSTLYQLPYKEPHNTEYPYYFPCFPPPPAYPSYCSSGNNSTPSSTPTTSMGALELSGMDIDPNTDETNVKEVVGGVAITAKMWAIKEDQLLISSWINCSTNPTVGTKRKRSSFWGKIATYLQ